MTEGRQVSDITGRADIEGLVSAFYQRAFAAPLLGPIFVDIAAMDLPAHLAVMCDFWESALLRTGSYRRNALLPHLRLNARIELTATHFRRWLALWSATLDERHRGQKTELAKVQATRIAGALDRRLRAQHHVDVHPSRVTPAHTATVTTGTGEPTNPPRVVEPSCTRTAGRAVISTTDTGATAAPRVPSARGVR